MEKITRNEAFQILAKSLYTLLHHENIIMMEKGSLTLENIIGHKTTLLETFNTLLETGVHDDLDESTCGLIKDVKNALKLNTGLQQAQFLHDQLCMDDLKDKLINRTEKEAAQCH